MINSLRRDWRETDKILVLVELGIVVAASFMGFQFMEYKATMEEEGCRVYYENFVPGFEYGGGEFLNSSEYEERKSNDVPGIDEVLSSDT